MTTRPAPVPPTTVVALLTRDRSREMLKKAFPRRRGRLVVLRTLAEFKHAFATELVDAAVVDVTAGGDDCYKGASLAADYPSVPFIGLAPMRVSDTPAVARCADLGFADVLADGVDDTVVREIILPLTFTARFAEALTPAAESLGLRTALQQKAWAAVVAQGGRPVHTDEVALRLAVTREHLSRSFSTAGAPNLKRIIDLVRLLAAAELAKNPGYDVTDVAAVLAFASSSHLTSTAQRIVGTRSASLARLRAGDILERFKGRGRSRTA
jgi:AraC-like DNA-binding protein